MARAGQRPGLESVGETPMNATARRQMNAPTQERSRSRDPRGPYQHLGVDELGDVHTHDTTNDRVFVVRQNGDIDGVYDLDDRSIQTWAAYVDSKRGWYSCGVGEFTTVPTEDQHRAAIKTLAAQHSTANDLSVQVGVMSAVATTLEQLSEVA